MPRVEIDYADRLDEMAAQLLKASAPTPLGAYDGHDLRQAAALIRRMREPKWISVEDRLPEHNAVTWTFSKLGVRMTHYDQGEWFVTGNMQIDPTHWQEAPKPPEAKP